MTDTDLSMRTLSRRAMDHALALTLPHAGSGERNALLTTALCADIVPAALGEIASGAAKLLDDPFTRMQAIPVLHAVIANTLGPEAAAVFMELGKGILNGRGDAPSDAAPMPAGVPGHGSGSATGGAPPRKHWRCLPRAREASADDREAVDIYVLDDREGLPPGARYVPGSLRVRGIGRLASTVLLSVRMRGDGVEVERQGEVPNPALYANVLTEGKLRARLRLNAAGFPEVELTQPLAAPEEVQVEEDATTPEAPAAAPSAPPFYPYPPDLNARHPDANRQDITATPENAPASQTSDKAAGWYQCGMGTLATPQPPEG